jgi:hypothetical protein
MMALVLRGITWAAGLAGVNLSGFAAGAVLAGLLTLAFAGYSAWVYRAGAEKAELRCEAAALRSRLAAKQTDLDAAIAAAADAQRARDESADRARLANERLQRIEDDAKSRPVAGCLATDADVQLRQPRQVRGRGR